MFRCFKRTWWKDNPDWPNGLEPEVGVKSYFRNGSFDNEHDARQFCRNWNALHQSGRYSLKAEFG
jgi:hypothetical protein